ncbi:bifunctional acetate--CoA ligase family protein/GNAT family N-acetyltransferase [Duganella sp. sic0402]|uniref:bifunctional acetate--CoA ligase family protein/GNAT family N-acetyltransferase n=1 Tax=Duganella sp. sic0402 TaxID=2854786 RepID=UPI001C4806EF|nr:bifunctional acetate--CoA ligase family protein/GNAT family N-acetyltransferase [Duganella sp. sic0402]MBV7535262.1 bifunctional acetate--CoA ligase family protein/GNAT family N-acetyltransferase [Duganella sp. sic0402]
MSIRNLDRLFQPRSVAVIGASDNPQRIGTRVLANLLAGDFVKHGGSVWPVNPKHQKLQGLQAYGRVNALPLAPDLAIICTPPATVPGLISELGQAGGKAAIVMTADPGHSGGRFLHQPMLEAARPYLLRVLGAGSAGLQSPALGLDASFTQMPAQKGKLAFVSQSAALATAVLDWAGQRGIGFSRFVAMGDGVDVDFGDLLDYLAADGETEAILLCIEHVSSARKFMSAGRLAARGKPVIVLKVGRDAAPGADLVFDAAIRRAGMLRVNSTEDLFDAVETLARQRPQRGERLAVLTNGGGLGLIAADALACSGAQLAALSPATQKLLTQAGAPHANPVGLLADAQVERYIHTVQALLREPQADALLFLHAPTAMVPSHRIAEAIAPLMQAGDKNVLSCWLGGGSVAQARRVFAEAGLPTYDTPEKAVHGFLQIAQYRRNQELLMEVPAGVPTTSAAGRSTARKLVQAALHAGHSELSDVDARALMSAYGIALATPQQAALAGATLAAARIQISHDPVFGPVVFFGQGGIAADVAADRAAGLPPLNMALARDMVSRTRVSRLLEQGQTPADAEALIRTLVQVADMVADLPELLELDLNPLLAIGGSVVALGARMQLAKARGRRAELAIRPYPQELEERLDWNGGQILLRPIKPEDGAQHQQFFSALAPEDIRLRFFSAMRELPPAQLARLTQIDYDRAMAFIATRPNAQGQAETLGVVRAVLDPDNQSAEFAVIVRSDLKGKGLGYILFQKLVDYFRARGTREIVGDALSENTGVQKMIRHFGGVVLPHPELGMVRLQLPLR